MAQGTREMSVARRAFRHVAACVVLAAASGCSFVMVRPPPDQARRASPESADCTDSYAAPVVDTVIGGVFAVPATALAANAGTSGYNKIGAVLLAIPAMVHVLSAAYGYVNVGKCRTPPNNPKQQPQQPKQPDPG